MPEKVSASVGTHQMAESESPTAVSFPEQSEERSVRRGPIALSRAHHLKENHEEQASNLVASSFTLFTAIH